MVVIHVVSEARRRTENIRGQKLKLKKNCHESRRQLLPTMNLSQRYARAQKALKPLNILQGYCRISSRERLGPNYCFFRTEFGSTRSYVVFQFILYFVSDFTFSLMSQAVRKLQELPFYSISYQFFYFTVHLPKPQHPLTEEMNAMESITHWFPWLPVLVNWSQARFQTRKTQLCLLDRK